MVVSLSDNDPSPFAGPQPPACEDSPPVSWVVGYLYGEGHIIDELYVSADDSQLMWRKREEVREQIMHQKVGVDLDEEGGEVLVNEGVQDAVEDLEGKAG